MRSIAAMLIVMMLAPVGEVIGAATADHCDTPQHHKFDFWLGDWQIKTTDGKLAGHNHVTQEYGSCVVHEHYTTTHGYSGESLNIYDASRKLWHQTWVDSDGTLLTLEGAFHHGQMVLQGRLVDKHGKSTRQRITWTPNADGSVRQLWEAAGPDAKWQVVFDGIYTRSQP